MEGDDNPVPPDDTLRKTHHLCNILAKNAQPESNHGEI